MASVPNVDQEAATDEHLRRHQETELRSLDAEARARENLNREADQRYELRYISVGLAFVMILLFSALAIHVIMNIPGLLAYGAAPVVVVGLYVPPIAAVVVLTVSLLLASFRGSKDGDNEALLKAGMDGTRVGSGLV